MSELYDGVTRHRRLFGDQSEWLLVEHSVRPQLKADLVRLARYGQDEGDADTSITTRVHIARILARLGLEEKDG